MSRYWKDTYWAVQKSLSPKILGGGGGSIPGPWTTSFWSSAHTCTCVSLILSWASAHIILKHQLQWMRCGVSAFHYWSLCVIKHMDNSKWKTLSLKLTSAERSARPSLLPSLVSSSSSWSRLCAHNSIRWVPLPDQPSLTHSQVHIGCRQQFVTSLSLSLLKHQRESQGDTVAEWWTLVHNWRVQQQCVVTGMMLLSGTLTGAGVSQMVNRTFFGCSPSHVYIVLRWWQNLWRLPFSECLPHNRTARCWHPPSLLSLSCLLSPALSPPLTLSRHILPLQSQAHWPFFLQNPRFFPQNLPTLCLCSCTNQYSFIYVLLPGCNNINSTSTTQQ